MQKINTDSDSRNYNILKKVTDCRSYQNWFTGPIMGLREPIPLNHNRSIALEQLLGVGIGLNLFF